MRPLLVLGRGALGASLAAALGISQAAGRAGPEEIAARLESGGAGITFLALPDQVLGQRAAALSAIRPRPDRAFVHLSGGQGLSVLAPLAAAGHRIGSFHPLQAFAQARPPEAFLGITVAVDAGDSELLSDLGAVAASLGASARRVTDEQRLLYHAAAVLASGDLVALAAAAGRVLEGIGWPPEAAMGALLPLMRGALLGLEEVGLPGALTGPIRRQDVTTLRGHLSALAEAGQDRALRIYRELGLEATGLVRRMGADGDSVHEMEAILLEVQA